MDKLNTNTIKTAYRFDSNGYFLGTDSVMEDSEGNLLLPSDDTMLEPELKEGYWSKFDKASNKWVEEKIPATCQEVIDAGLSVVSNSSEPHDRELIDLFARLVEAEKDVYQLHMESGTLVQTIEKIPAPTDEELAQQIRAKRNSLLSQTDYLMMPDYPISDDKRKLIEEYRHALRDIPEQSGFPRNITWPEKP